MQVKFALKSGDSGYFDYDNCDSILSIAETNFIPRIGEKVKVIQKRNVDSFQAIVKDIEYQFWGEENESQCVYVYVYLLDKTYKNLISGN